MEVTVAGNNFLRGREDETRLAKEPILSWLTQEDRPVNECLFTALFCEVLV